MSKLGKLQAATNKIKDSLVKAVTMPSRGLTSGEVDLSRKVFKNSIDYSKVKIFTGNYLPNQDKETFMAPNGNIYAPAEVYFDDYSTQVTWIKKAFLHEMGHVWQFQSKINVKLVAGSIHACAFFTKDNPYLYDIYERKTYPSPTIPNLIEHLPKKFIDYNLEAQAEIISDYYLLKYTNQEIQHMRVANIKTNITHKGTWDKVVKAYEDKISEAIPQT